MDGTFPSWGMICSQSRRREATGSTSVDNALWLLQLVAERQALRVSEAADLLGVARSTAHRLLSALPPPGLPDAG